MSNSSERRTSRKPKLVKPPKPYDDFPLTPHASGTWMKKIKGKIRYFGRWGRRVDGKMQRIDGDGWQAALELYKAQADDLHAGREPRAKQDGEGLTVGVLCNHFLTAKLRKKDSGEITRRTFCEYKTTTDLLVSKFGSHRRVDDITPGDFESLRADMAEKWGPTRLGKIITFVKSVFRYAEKNDLIGKPVRYGSEFAKPDKAVMRRHKTAKGNKALTAEQIRKMLDAADTLYRALILVGINAAYGNHDCAALPFESLDLKEGWIDFPRPKTSIERRCKLWPETTEAIQAWLAVRPTPKDDEAAKLVFLTERGTPLIRETESGRTDNIVQTFTALCKAAKVHSAGLGFYALRRAFRTSADATLDRAACDLVMGHSDPSMGAHYVQGIDDARLERVAEHVRQWLFEVDPKNWTTAEGVILSEESPME
jgi:integrase